MPRLKAQQRREQLVEVATHLFARSGYEATTTAAIAQAAGVTEPILYRHFKSKQELFVAIVREVSVATLQQWKALINGVDDPAERLRRIAAALPDHMKRLSDYYHVLHGALASNRDKKVVAVIRAHYEQIEAFFAGIVKDGQQRGVFRSKMNPSAAAWQFIFAGIGYGMIALNLGAPDRDLVTQVIESLIAGFAEK